MSDEGCKISIKRTALTQAITAPDGTESKRHTLIGAALVCERCGRQGPEAPTFNTAILAAGAAGFQYVFDGDKEHFFCFECAKEGETEAQP